MKDQHTMITGFRDLTQTDIDMMNMIKAQESSLAGLFRIVQNYVRSTAGRPEDFRQIAIAKTNFEAGFMHLVRSVARPISPWLGDAADQPISQVSSPPVTTWQGPISPVTVTAAGPEGFVVPRNGAPAEPAKPASIQPPPRRKSPKKRSWRVLTPFGKELYAAMERANISRTDLASKIGVCAGHVSGLAYGKSNVKPAVVERICAVLQCDPVEKRMLFKLASESSGYRAKAPPLANGATTHEDVVSPSP